MQLLDTTQVLFSTGSGTKKGVWVLALPYPKPLLTLPSHLRQNVGLGEEG